LFRNFSAGIFLESCCIKLVIFFADLDWTRSAISTQILVRIQPCTAVLFRNQQQSVLKHIVHNHSSTNAVACTQIWSLSQLLFIRFTNSKHVVWFRMVWTFFFLQEWTSLFESTEPHKIKADWKEPVTTDQTNNFKNHAISMGWPKNTVGLSCQPARTPSEYVGTVIHRSRMTMSIVDQKKKMIIQGPKRFSSTKWFKLQF